LNNRIKSTSSIVAPLKDSITRKRQGLPAPSPQAAQAFWQGFYSDAALIIEIAP
jgi:hypothetical protein